MDLIHTIESNRDQNKHTVALFLDFSKAFDTVNHQILLNKLNHYGFRGKTQNFLASYLTDRQQYTMVNQNKSCFERVTFGVPQGSILGPLLFLIYINDINSKSQVDFKLFADDTVIMASHPNLSELQQISDIAIKDIQNWLYTNRLTLNHKKTVYLFFDSHKKQSNSVPPKIVLNNWEISCSSSAKYLGFIVDTKLSCKQHIHSLIQKLIRFIGHFRAVSKYTSLQGKKLLYNSMFYPHLVYCIEVYGNSSQQTIKELQTVQNKALKALFRFPRLFPSSTMYAKLKFQKVNELYESRAISFVKKNLSHDLITNPIFNLQIAFANQDHYFKQKYNTRNKGNIRLNFKKQSYTSGIVFQMLLIYNKNDNNYNC
jgi:hypothetical protein